MKKISKSQYNFIKKELLYIKSHDLIDDSVEAEILSLYSVLERPSFNKILLSLSALLLGLGIFSLVATNWALIPKYFKLCLILCLYLSFSVSSIFLEKRNSQLYRPMSYLSALSFGGGIFLIGQIFHFNSGFENAFLAWSIGVLSLAITFDDFILNYFSKFLFLIYLLNFSGNLFSSFLLYTLLFLGISLFLEFKKSGTKLTFSLLLSLIFILKSIWLYNYNLDLIWYLAITLLFSISSLIYGEYSKNGSLIMIGQICLGISGISLTYEYPWTGILSIPRPFIISIIACMSLLLTGFLFYLIRKGFLFSIFLVCILFLRYYFDLFYDFMPKSVFFISSGLILGGFTLYFDKKRKKGGLSDEIKS